MHHRPRFFFIVSFVWALLISPLAVHAAQDNIDWPKVADYEQNLINYRTHLKSSYQFINALKDAYLKNFSLQDSAQTRNAAFLVFKKEYEEIIRYLSTENCILLKDWLDIRKNSTNATVKEDRKKLQKLEQEAQTWGFIIEDRSGEGDYDVTAKPNMAYLLQFFGPHLTTDWQDYFTLFTSTLPRNRTLSEEEYFAEIEDERKTLLAYETYVKKHPLAPMAVRIRKETGEKLYYYTSFNNNTVAPAKPVNDEYNREWYTLHDAYKASYEKFIQENKDSLLYPAIREMYNALKKKNFLFTYKDSEAITAAITKKANAAGFVYEGW